VRPAYRSVDGPGHEILPRTPQNRTRMEAFNIPRRPKIYLTGYIWNGRQCRGGRSGTGKTFPICLALVEATTAGKRFRKMLCHLSGDEIAETDAGAVSSDRS